MNNGWNVAKRKQVQAKELPFVQVVADQSKAGPDNPNGIGIVSNMNVGGKQSPILLIQMMSEAINLLARGIQSGQMTGQAVSPNIVLPDGSPAPLPTEE